jgi:hypothetical protein
MTTDLETEVRAAFAAHAAELPPTALARVRAVDYRPRAARLTMPARVGLGAGVLTGAATAGAALSVALGGAAPAYAGWSATPTAAPSAASAPQAAQSCLSSLPSHEPAGTGDLGSGSWQTVLTDVRGPFTVALFQNDGAYASCFTSSSFTEVMQVATNSSAASNAQSVNGVVRTSGSGNLPGGLSTVTVGGTSSGDLQNVVQTHLSTTADGPYTLLEGRVASGVTGVTLVRDDGQDVVATVADGCLLAWWPGDATATASQVTTASGTSTEPLQLSTKTPPAPGAPLPGACASAGGTSANASKAPSGGATNAAVHCAGSGNSGSSGGGSDSNSGGGGSGSSGGPSGAAG